MELFQSVGDDIFQTKANQGAIFVAVQYMYKNVSSKPVSSFSLPKIRLVDGNGTEYEADIDASSSYATVLHLDEKILSDLNPGISSRGAEVFEVSKELFNPSTWRIKVKADGESFFVAFKTKQSTQQDIPTSVPTVGSTAPMTSAMPVQESSPPSDSQAQTQNQEREPDSPYIAYVNEPPSNIRESPNGPVLCVIEKPMEIALFAYAGSTYNGKREMRWYVTDACGSEGVIADTEFR